MLNYKAKTAYDEDQAVTYDKERFATKSGAKIHETETGILKAAIRIASEDKKDIKILEVGCGTGRLLIEVCKDGYRVDGIDASPDMLTQCNKKIAGQFPDTKLTLGEASRLPYPDNSYDFVYSIRVLNQTESSEYALNIVNEMLRVAKPNSNVLVEFVNYYRPRLNRSKYRGIHLRPNQVINCANKRGARLVWCRGAFFFGMTGLHIVPDFLVAFISICDEIFSKLFPKLCSRCYILFQVKVR